MLHFTKDEEAFRRFCVELVSANPGIMNLRKVGVDMEAAIFNGFQSVITKLLQLYCARHLQERDQLAIDKCHQKSKISDDRKASYKKEIIWDIYGKRTNDTLEKGIAEASDSDLFNARLLSLQPRWDKLCPGFYNWFITHRKKEFIQSVIESAREGTNVCGLYYQNDIESQHAVEKRIQCFKMGSVLDAVSTIRTLITREENEEVLALYGSGNYVLSKPYKKWFAAQWHSWPTERKERYLMDFRSSKPAVEDTFVKPANSGQKMNYQKRVRLNSPPTFIVDRHIPTTSPTLLVATTAPLTTSTALLTTSTALLTTISQNGTQTAVNSQSISFADPREEEDTLFELHLRSELSKQVKRCQGNCGRDITQAHKLVVKSAGIQIWSVAGKEMYGVSGVS